MEVIVPPVIPVAVLVATLVTLGSAATLSIPFCLQALVLINKVSIARVPVVVIIPHVIPVPLLVATEVTVHPAGIILIELST